MLFVCDSKYYLLVKISECHYVKRRPLSLFQRTSRCGVIDQSEFAIFIGHVIINIYHCEDNTATCLHCQKSQSKTEKSQRQSAVNQAPCQVSFSPFLFGFVFILRKALSVVDVYHYAQPFWHTFRGFVLRCCLGTKNISM